VAGLFTLGEEIINTAGTSFILPLLTSVICTGAVRRDICRGTLQPRPMGPRLSLLAGGRLRRGLRLGIVCVVTVFPLTVLVQLSANVGAINPVGYVLYSTTLAVALGMAVTPVVAFRAMADPPVPLRIDADNDSLR
jgi:hypothetical protein